MKIFKESECDCQICSSMCHSACCGTPAEILRIMDAGYGDRLCLDDWEDSVPDIHPALKGFEARRAPWETDSLEGCTFWKEGKCELHDKGLKPLGGRFAHHDLSNDDWMQLKPFLLKQWSSPTGRRVLEKWKKTYIENEHDTN